MSELFCLYALVNAGGKIISGSKFDSKHISFVDAYGWTITRMDFRCQTF